MEDTAPVPGRIPTPSNDFVIRQFTPARVERLLLTRLFDLTTGSHAVEEPGELPNVPLSGLRTGAGREAA